MQLDLLQMTGEQANMEKTMDVLNMIRKGQQKRARLSQAQFLMSKTYRGTDYTSAHQPPVLDSHPELCYRGHGYIK